MKYLKYIIAVMTVLTVLTFLIFQLYFHYDIPQYSGEKTLTGLQDTVDIFTDKFGVPHIFAKYNEDLFFTAGYIIARDRLFQLSLFAAIARGEISTILGNDYVKYDEYIKQNNLFSLNINNISMLNDENILLLNSFCSGINTWINETKDSLPLSFKILKTNPLKWSTEDVVNVATIMTDNSLQYRKIKWFINQIGQYFDDQKLLEIFPVNLYNTVKSGNDYSDSSNKLNIKIEEQILKLIGVIGSPLPSNVLIVPNEQTVSKKPLLIIEDVWGLLQPAKWFDIHLKGGDFNVEGSIIPGFPIPLVGKTGNTAWSFTGKITGESANALFDIAAGNIKYNDISNIFLSYADTSGFYHNPKELSRQFKLLQGKLAESNNINVYDVVSQLSATKNTTKAEMAQRIVNMYLENNSKKNEAYLDKLYEWDIHESVVSPETLLINVIYTKLLENIFNDELSLVGENIFKTFVNLPIIADQSINKILNNTEASWIDDIKTVNYQESLIETVIKSVDEAIDEIENDFGSNIQKWQLGNVQIYKHILDGKSIHAKIFSLNVGSFSSNSNIDFNDSNFDNFHNQL